MCSDIGKGRPDRAQEIPATEIAKDQRYSNRTVKCSIKAVSRPGCVLPTYPACLRH